MTAPGTPLSQSTGRKSTPPAFPEVPSLMPAASGAAAGNLHLTPEQEEAVAAYLARVWRGATGLSEVPPPEMLSTLVDVTMRKARDVAASRTG
ncbi:hypothetical protein EDF57_103563 [Novosphingobium sp. PhB55]|uniref:hypothetical protein n=1 Tax=Novosphingobium sp. PhB55 TaxID=2485106 RepID=UPI0010F2194F|nr:hypothetical protein [Novosphingobium sp. PhB55]TDW65379.1 hypothetical protein EDF57_103563 [Novosphingobium sp. PhB55]